MKWTQLNIWDEIKKTEPQKKAWYIGLPCKERWWFDLMKEGIDIEIMSKPWEIEDYKKNNYIK